MKAPITLLCYKMIDQCYHNNACYDRNAWKLQRFL